MQVDAYLITTEHLLEPVGARGMSEPGFSMKPFDG